MAKRYDDREYRRGVGGGGRYDERTGSGPYDQERGFLDWAGDEVRSKMGDEEAERRRRMDEQRDR